MYKRQHQYGHKGRAACEDRRSGVRVPVLDVTARRAAAHAGRGILNDG